MMTKKSRPFITVVTVCYNAVNVIEKTILSVISQTYSNVEYIVVDGGSTDGTIDVIKKYEEKIDKWVSESDNGIYDAMNKAIGMATGEWINFMNAGDQFFDKHVIEKLSSAFDEKHDVIYGNTVFVHGNFLSYKKARILPQRLPKFVHQSSFVLTHFMRLYSFDQKYTIGADHDFFYKMFKKGKDFYYVDMTISLFNMDGISANHRAIVYKEECEIENREPSLLKLMIYKLEDALPIWLMRWVLAVKWNYLKAKF